ncbi:ion transporter [Oceanicoccus sagamiensis]|uniref:Ion transporter n=1 Tax=Oceanicoccus sagamiensis TaxID=716816 RepID=A0A1X9NE82_9GAMM|nr:ion transporter [Oceanicoccus sagamiensis]ARN75461.1 ion transporter [Oceanicoccus sagamiensis]
MTTEISKENLREKLYRIIFGTDTPAGKRFDLILIVAILLSVTAVILDSIEAWQLRYAMHLFYIEWFFTLLFTLEFIARIYCSPNPKAYITSFYGIVDLLAILPTYISLFVPSASLLLVIRLLRVMRIFRVLKLLQYSGEANALLRSLLMARRKIFIFLFFVLILVTIFGSLMYIIEGPIYGFTSIPRSIYWAIVTVTTVGYGDITPHTIFGQAIAALAMLTGYAIIAVPTGIISAELISEMQRERTVIRCSNCERFGHEADAEYCRFCGTELKYQRSNPIVDPASNSTSDNKAL